MRTQSRDTHPQAEKVQIELMRHASPARRFALARSLSAQSIAASRRAIRERMPRSSEIDVLLKWVELAYGNELSRQVRRYLDGR